MYYDKKDYSGYYIVKHDGRQSQVILSKKNLPIELIFWPLTYVWETTRDNVTSVTSREQYEVAKWCEENLENDWLIGSSHCGFMTELDYVTFKLRWL